MLQFLLGIILAGTSLFLVLLVLVQRGRGGGLTGALGGAGGQSAFGSKAGDVCTKITIGIACAWLLLCVCTIKLVNNSAQEVAREELTPAVGGSGDSTDTGTGTGTGTDSGGTNTGTGSGDETGGGTGASDSTEKKDEPAPDNSSK